MAFGIKRMQGGSSANRGEEVIIRGVLDRAFSLNSAYTAFPKLGVCHHFLQGSRRALESVHFIQAQSSIFEIKICWHGTLQFF